MTHDSQNDLRRELGIAPGMAEIRGARVLNRTASPGIRAAALIADFSMAVILSSGLKTWAPRFPSLAVVAVFALWVWGFRRFASLTPGELFWGLSRKRDTEGRWNWKESPLELERPSAVRRVSGILLTLISFAIASLGVNQILLTNPLWVQAAEIHQDALAPETDANWSAMPFFYALGTWPTTYAGHPVFYGLPYEKGPPEKFAGHVFALWENPNTTLVIEGPKTPRRESGAPYSREEIRHCLRELIPWDCQRVRDAVLGRHLAEIEKNTEKSGKTSPILWTLQWRVISNPRLAAGEETQGVYLRAESAENTEERFIAISPAGTEQTIALSRPAEDRAREAGATFEKIIRSLRMSDDLKAGRAWINERLQAIRLEELERSGDPTETARALSGIQALLLSKISVEPSVFESYYHLGGTAVRLFQLGAQSKDLTRSSEWSAIARPLIESAARYARDVSPQDPRVPILEKMSAQAQMR